MKGTSRCHLGRVVVLQNINWTVGGYYNSLCPHLSLNFIILFSGMSIVAAWRTVCVKTECRLEQYAVKYWSVQNFCLRGKKEFIETYFAKNKINNNPKKHIKHASTGLFLKVECNRINFRMSWTSVTLKIEWIYVNRM